MTITRNSRERITTAHRRISRRSVTLVSLERWQGSHWGVERGEQIALSKAARKTIVRFLKGAICGDSIDRMAHGALHVKRTPSGGAMLTAGAERIHVLADELPALLRALAGEPSQHARCAA